MFTFYSENKTKLLLCTNLKIYHQTQNYSSLFDCRPLSFDYPLSAMDKKLIEDFDKKQKASKHKRKREFSSGHHHPSTKSSSSVSTLANINSKVKKTKQTAAEPEFIQPSTSYRDRAKERREGINKDFELDPDDIKFSNPTIDNVLDKSIDDDSEQPIDEEERRRQQIEESKYLGGDVEHTHLVKGLDFALLEKVKNDQKLAEKLTGDSDRNLSYGDDEDSDSDEEKFRNEAILAASLTATSKRQLVNLEKLKKGQSTDLIDCRYALTKRILHVLEEKWPNKSELFLPGRMSYVIPIGEDCEDDSAVTTILRSKSDTSVQDESAPLNESDFALDQLINILGKIRRGETHSDSSKKIKSWEQDDGLNDYGY